MGNSAATSKLIMAGRLCAFLGLLSGAPSAPVAHADKETVASAATADGSAIEDTDDGWVWTGMVSVKGADYHGGTVHAGGPGTVGVYVFDGGGITLYSFRGKEIMAADKANLLGKIKISIDGKEKETVDLAAPQSEAHVPVFTAGGLKGGMHVLQIKPVGGWGVVDNIVVTKPAVEADGGMQVRLSPRSVPGKFISLENGAVANGTVALLWAEASDRGEIWRLIPLGDDKYRISPQDSPNQALTVLSRTITSRSGSQCTMTGLYPYSGASAQQWSITRFQNDYYEIASVMDGKCLNVMENVNDDAGVIIMWTWQNGSGTNDQWLIKPVGK